MTYGPQTQSQGGISAADIVAAAKVNLGLFGIAVEYTFKVVRMKNVLFRRISRNVHVSDVFSTPEKIQVQYNYIIVHYINNDAKLATHVRQGDYSALSM